jgi:UDP-4-amino-4,6-dideoxy-N-acetyl-beta-L-altrosamine transaminase
VKFIPYARQTISDDDIAAVVEVLRSDYLTQGPQIDLFEDSLRCFAGANYALATNSATSALHIACLALGVGSGDIVWTSPNSFVASANCALYCGAQVDFIDIDPSSMNISIECLIQKLEFAATRGKLPKVVIPVHFGGNSCDMRSIGELSKRYGFRVIEDASHAIGGQYNGRNIGSCEFSDCTIFSFHPVKIITTGEGGALMTNSRELAESAKLYRSHGINRKAVGLDTIKQPWFYEQELLGFNYRITDIQAALGVSQLKKIEKFIAKRRKIAAWYETNLSSFRSRLHLPLLEQNSGSAFHLYVIQILGIGEEQRARIFRALRAAGIGVNVHYIPIHLHPFYKALGFSTGDYPNAEQIYHQVISLPMYPELSLEEVGYVCDLLKTEVEQELCK